MIYDMVGREEGADGEETHCQENKSSHRQKLGRILSRRETGTPYPYPPVHKATTFPDGDPC